VAVLSILAMLPAARQAAPRHKVKLPADYKAWTRVAHCEEGGWIVRPYSTANGTYYPDALGIDNTNYAAFGGRNQRPGVVPLAHRVVEIRVADRLVKRYAIPIPDQHGCAAW
jgi:hypothetical protein